MVQSSMFVDMLPLSGRVHSVIAEEGWLGWLETAAGTTVRFASYVL